MEDGDHDVEDVAGLKHEEQELLVVLAKFPEKYQKFLKKTETMWRKFLEQTLEEQNLVLSLSCYHDANICNKMFKICI